MKNFKDLEIGDEVLLFSSDRTKVVKISRKTKTQLVVNNSKFRMSDGEEVGSSIWNHSHIEIVSDEELRAQKEKEYHLELTRKLHNFKGYGRFNTNRLEEIFRLLDMELPKKNF